MAVQAGRDAGQRQKQLWHGRIPPLTRRRGSSGDGVASPGSLSSLSASPIRGGSTSQSKSQPQPSPPPEEPTPSSRQVNF